MFLKSDRSLSEGHGQGKGLESRASFKTAKIYSSLRMSIMGKHTGEHFVASHYGSCISSYNINFQTFEQL